MKEKLKKVPWYWWGIIILIGIWMIAGLFEPKNTPKSYTGLDAVVFSEDYFKKHYLKDPNSYHRVNYTATPLGSNKFDCTVEYRAKNSFGGYVTDTFEAIVVFDTASGTVNYDFVKK